MYFSPLCLQWGWLHVITNCCLQEHHMAEDREVLKDDRVVESEAPVDPSNSK